MTFIPKPVFQAHEKTKPRPHAEPIDCLPIWNLDRKSAHFATLVQMIDGDDETFRCFFYDVSNGTKPKLTGIEKEFPRSGLADDKPAAFPGLPSTVGLWLEGGKPADRLNCVLLIDREYFAQIGLDQARFAIPEGKWPISLSKEIQGIIEVLEQVVENAATRLNGLPDLDVEKLRKIVARYR